MQGGGGHPCRVPRRRPIAPRAERLCRLLASAVPVAGHRCSSNPRQALPALLLIREGAVSGRGAGAPTAGEDGKGTTSRCGRSWPAHRLPWRLGDVALGRGGVTRQGAASGRRRKVWRDASRSAPRSPHPVRPLLPLVPKSQPTSFQPFLPPPQQALMWRRELGE